MPLSMERWRDYWSTKQDPLWGPAEGDLFFSRYRHELEALLVGRRRSRVLEIGCGNGVVYRLLGLSADGYVGVDFSQSMLDDFARRCPEVSLVCADGSAYGAGGPYDVVISSGVLQFFDDAMLRRHFALAASCLAPDGVLVCASLPWRSMRWRYLYGDLYDVRRSGWGRMAARWLRYALTGDPLGRWFEPADLRLGGFQVETLGSVTMPYRFHACLTRR